jgi:hypothetical protein
MLMSRQPHSGGSAPPVIAGIHQANHCSRSFTGRTAITSIGTTASSSQQAVAWLPMQRRLASSQSPAAEASLMWLEFHWHLSDTPWVRNTALFRVPQRLTGSCTHCLRNMALLGATTSQWLLHTLPACLPACSSVYSVNRSRHLL